MKIVYVRAMRTTLLALVVVLGCGKTDEPGKDWSAKPLDQSIADKVNNIGFKFSLPAGWKLDDIDKDSKDPAALHKEWRPDMKDYFSEPHVTIGFDAIPPKTLDDVVKDAIGGDAKLEAGKKEQTADGFVVVTHTKNNGRVVVNRWIMHGDAAVTCRAAQAKTGGVPSPDATTAWLDKICQSLKLD